MALNVSTKNRYFFTNSISHDSTHKYNNKKEQLIKPVSHIPNAWYVQNVSRTDQVEIDVRFVQEKYLQSSDKGHTRYERLHYDSHHAVNLCYKKKEEY